MGTLRFFEEVVSFKIRRTFGFADYTVGKFSVENRIPFHSTRSRDRTGTTLLSLVFETNASTNSAIRAAKSVICSAKVMIYRGTPNFFRIFLRPYCLPKWTRSLAALAGPTSAESSSVGAVRIFSTVRKWRNRSSMVFGPTPSIFSSSL